MKKWKDRRVYVLLGAVILAGVIIIAYKNIAPPIPLDLRAGTFTGTGEGYGGQVSVTVSIDSEGTITAAAVSGDNESADIGGKYIADGTFAQQIIDLQHYDIDGVSGATYTSYGVREAAEDALTQAEN